MPDPESPSDSVSHLRTVAALLSLLLLLLLPLMVGFDKRQLILSHDTSPVFVIRSGGRIRFCDSWSQHEEDIILAEALWTVPVGFWVDVGAHDPFVLSVTAHFYQLGWRGINIDPLPNMYEALKRTRPRDINLHVGCGAEAGHLYVVKGWCGGPCAHIVPSPTPGAIPVEIVPLTTVFERYVPEGTDVHFCKIDVEGYEKQVLLGMNLTRYRPWTFCLENFGQSVPWEPILTQAGYRFAMVHHPNRFYYDAIRHPELATVWAPITELRKRWRIVRH